MKKILLLIIAATLIVAAAMTLSSCKNWDNPYEAIDKEGDAISIRYLANGGTFAQEETAVLYDVYKLSSVKEVNGKKTVSIIAPEDNRRSLAGGKDNKDFIVHKDPKAYKLAGWAEVVTDDNGNPVLDDNGNYQLGKRWDFSKDVISIDPEKSYSSTQPVLTLAAIWSSYYSFEFYMQNALGEWVAIENSTQSNINTLIYPIWKDGKLNMKDYPTIDGKTFVTAYSDPEMTNEITGDVTPEVAEDGNNVMKIYTTWQEGNWYRITEGNQINSINDLNGNYIIMNDVVVTKWRSAYTKGTFNGSILSAKAAGIENGKDYKISGLSTDSIKADKNNKSVGLFASIGANAKIAGITFDNITVNFQGSASDVTERYYGLLAGTIEDGAEFTDVKITNCKLVFKTYYGQSFFDTYFNVDPETGALLYETTNVINLVADGNTTGIQYTEADVTVVYEGGAPAEYDITVNSEGTLIFTKKES